MLSGAEESICRRRDVHFGNGRILGLYAPNDLSCGYDLMATLDQLARESVVSRSQLVERTLISFCNLDPRVHLDLASLVRFQALLDLR